MRLFCYHHIRLFLENYLKNIRVTIDKRREMWYNIYKINKYPSTKVKQVEQRR